MEIYLTYPEAFGQVIVLRKRAVLFWTNGTKILPIFGKIMLNAKVTFLMRTDDMRVKDNMPGIRGFILGAICWLVAVVPFGSCLAKDKKEDDHSPSGFTLLCNEGEKCDAGKSSFVMYQKGDFSTSRVICGSFTCEPKLFTEKDPDKKKKGACYASDTKTGDGLNNSLAAVPGKGMSVPDGVPPDSKLPGYGKTGTAADCKAGGLIKDMIVDCEGASIGLSCNGQSESQKAVLTLENATVKNVILKKGGGADGIHCMSGDCALVNVVWEDICEDAATNKSDGGTMAIYGGWAYNEKSGKDVPDKIFEHNSKNSTIIVTGGFIAKGENAFLVHSCGNCPGNGGPRHFIVKDVTVDGTITSAIASYNKNFKDTVQISNIKIKNYKPGSPRICFGKQANVGGKDGGLTTYGEDWNDATCEVKQTDITPF